jgi:PiT family inorganic phosphate transporter
MTLVLILAVAAVAFTNGANANFKCVASLAGSGILSLRTAGWYGTVATLMGSIASLPLAGGLLAAFGGKGIVPTETAASTAFITSVALAGALTSFLATRLGFPVSTTHALLGGLVGAGLAAGSLVHWPTLARLIAIPLMLSPLIAILAGMVFAAVLRSSRIRGDQGSRTMDTLHILIAGVASFARGLNDTPKMAALAIVIPSMSVSMAFIAVGVLIALGGLFDLRRVAVTLSTRITAMNPVEGFLAGMVTAALVTVSSVYSWPVSTTHVSVGSLVGIGAVNQKANWRTIRDVVIAWVTTVPCGIAIAGMASLALR